MSDYGTMLKPDPVECGCGCGRVGRLRTKPWRDGTHCVRNCDKNQCPRCRGSRNKKQGQRKQSRMAKRLGVEGSGRGLPSNEERFGDYFANEMKHGRQCGPVANFWRKHEAQVLANEPDYGAMRRPVRLVANPEGWGDEGIVMVRVSTWEEHIRPALNEFWGQDK